MSLPDNYVPMMWAYIRDLMGDILTQIWDYLPVRFQALLYVMGILSLILGAGLGALVVFGLILTCMEPELRETSPKTTKAHHRLQPQPQSQPLSQTQPPSRVSRKRPNPEVYKGEFNPNHMD